MRGIPKTHLKMKVQTVYRAAALQGALHPHLRNFHRKEHTPRKILKQRTAGNLDDFSRNTDTWTNHATQEEGADFFRGEGSSYQENPDFIRQQNGKRQKKQKKSVSSRTKKKESPLLWP